MASYRQLLEDAWSSQQLPAGRTPSAATVQVDGVQPSPHRQLRRAVLERVMQAVERDGTLSSQNQTLLRLRVRRIMRSALRDLGVTRLTDREDAALEDAMIAELAGFGPLQPLMDDAGVSDVLVNGSHDVWADRYGRLEPTPVQFDDEAHLVRVLNRLVATSGRHLEEAAPYVDARLPDGSRLHAMAPPLSRAGTVLAIRKARTIPLSFDDLCAAGTMNQVLGRLLASAVRGRLSLLVSGGASAGKTTLLNVLSRFIPEHERLVTIEETAELRLDHPHVVTLEARLPNIEGRGEVTLRTLVRNALRMRADRIIVGEVRGGEVFDMLQAMNVGHGGSMTTVHANSPDDALRRLETLVLLGGFELPSSAVQQLLGSAFDVVVQTERFPDGSRRITHIGEVAWTDGELGAHPFFVYDPETGGHAPTGYRPGFLSQLRALDPDIDSLFHPLPEGNPDQAAPC